MKRTLLIFFAALSLVGQAQFTTKTIGTPKEIVRSGGVRADSIFVLNGITMRFKADTLQAFTNGEWKAISGNSLFNGNRSITATVSGLQGVTPGTEDVASFLNAVFYPTQVPTATLSATYGGNTATTLTLEQMAAGSGLSVTLNWGAGRQASTEPLSAITVDGISLSFSQPAAPGSVSGTTVATVPRNVDKSLSNAVVTTDGKSASAAATVLFRWKRYWGFVSATSPGDATIQALTNEFLSARTRAASTALTPSGSQYFVIAFPESFDAGNTSQIWVGGLDQTASFTRTVRSFTNASGGVTNYIIYTSNSTTSGSVSYEIK